MHFAACSTYPCALDRSNCVLTTLGHVCICQDPYSGLSSPDGSTCRMYHMLFSAYSEVALDSNGNGVQVFTAPDQASCRVHSEAVKRSVQIFAYSSSTISCWVFTKVPKRNKVVTARQDTYVAEVYPLALLPHPFTTHFAIDSSSKSLSAHSPTDGSSSPPPQMLSIAYLSFAKSSQWSRVRTTVRQSQSARG